MNAFTIPKSTFAQQMQANRKMARDPKPSQHIVIPPTDKHRSDWMAAIYSK